jgi:hypothetical protein
LYLYIFIHTQLSLVPAIITYLQINNKEYIEDLHPIYGLYTHGDETVIEDKPHAPQEEIPIVATDDLDKK